MYFFFFYKTVWLKLENCKLGGLVIIWSRLGSDIITETDNFIAMGTMQARWSLVRMNDMLGVFLTGRVHVFKKARLNKTCSKTWRLWHKMLKKQFSLMVSVLHWVLVWYICVCAEPSKVRFASLVVIRWLKCISLRARPEELTQIMSEVQKLSCIWRSLRGQREIGAAEAC